MICGALSSCWSAIINFFCCCFSSEAAPLPPASADLKFAEQFYVKWDAIEDQWKVDVEKLPDELLDQSKERAIAKLTAEFNGNEDRLQIAFDCVAPRALLAEIDLFLNEQNALPESDRIQNLDLLKSFHQKWDAIETDWLNSINALPAGLYNPIEKNLLVQFNDNKEQLTSALKVVSGGAVLAQMREWITLRKALPAVNAFIQKWENVNFVVGSTSEYTELAAAWNKDLGVFLNEITASCAPGIFLINTNISKHPEQFPDYAGPDNRIAYLEHQNRQAVESRAMLLKTDVENADIKLVLKGFAEWKKSNGLIFV